MEEQEKAEEKLAEGKGTQRAKRRWRTSTMAVTLTKKLTPVTAHNL